MRKNHIPSDNEKELHRMKDRLLNRAWGYSELEMYKDALDECKKLVELDPDDASSFIELGYYYEKSGEVEKAIKCYKDMMERFPKDSYPYVSLGYIYEKYKKSNAMATVCYEKALELDPSDEWALNNVGVMLQKEGKWKEALSYYEKAYEASKASGEANSWILHNLAWAYCLCKNYNKAKVLYQQLVNDEEYVRDSVYYDFGCVSYKMGDYNRAMELFEKALSLCPDNRKFKRGWKEINRKVKTI